MATTENRTAITGEDYRRDRRAPGDRRAPARRLPGRPIPLAGGAPGAARGACRDADEPSHPDPGGAEQRLRRTPAAGGRPDRSAGPRRTRRVCGRTARRLDGEPSRGAADPLLYGSGRAYVQPQPKGVIGNIVPWNFPFDLSVGPLIEMLAAGNRVVIKPSEYTPACARAAARDGPRDLRPRSGRRRRRRPGARARVHPRSLGSPALHGQPGDRARDRKGRGRAARAGDARAGRQVPGDPHRGQRRRRVGQAGARDQGDQERADVHLGRLLPRAARAAGGLRRLWRATYARESMPGYCSSASCTGIISSRHLERIQGLLEDARARGLRRAAAGGGHGAATRPPASCRSRS